MRVFGISDCPSNNIKRQETWSRDELIISKRSSTGVVLVADFPLEIVSFRWWWGHGLQVAQRQDRGDRNNLGGGNHYVVAGSALFAKRQNCSIPQQNE